MLLILLVGLTLSFHWASPSELKVVKADYYSHEVRPLGPRICTGSEAV